MCPLRFVFKLYGESRGAGLNLYVMEQRVLGLEGHQFLRKSEHAKPEFIWRPHIDVPPLDVHHWPFANVDLSELRKQQAEEAATRRSEHKDELQWRQTKRSEKTERKMARRRAGTELVGAEGDDACEFDLEL